MLSLILQTSRYDDIGKLELEGKSLVNIFTDSKVNINSDLEEFISCGNGSSETSIKSLAYANFNHDGY